MSKAQSGQTQSTQPQAAQTKVARKRTGEARRDARKRVGAPVSLKPIDLATAAKPAEAQEANGRASIASGRTQRADAEANCEAFPAIEVCFVNNLSGLAKRGAPLVVMHGAKLVYERLLIIVEVEAMSAASPVAGTLLDDSAFVAKRRDAVVRILPGISNAPARAKFGLHQLVRQDSPATLKKAAQSLLAGKKAAPKSRAAKLITADDEKRLTAIVKSISSNTTEMKQARAAGVSRTTERDILNTALELFYDDFAASIGLVLEDDEVARLQALGLVPRKADSRAATDKEKGGSAGASASTSAGSTGSAGSTASGTMPASPAPVTA